MAPLAPRLSSEDTSSAFSQFTYDLPHSHIYTSQFYPRSLHSRPTTLSEVLVCGHESGITILWRAEGVPKKVRKDASSGKSKGVARDVDDDAMLLDGPLSKSDATNGSGERERARVVDGKRFVCSYMIRFGIAVHHISFPPASILPSNLDTSRHSDDDEEEDPLKSLSNNLLQNNFLIAAICADRSIRLVTLPRTPPPPNQTAKKREHVVVLGTGVQGHREVASAVSVTIVPSVNTTYSPEHSEGGSPVGSPDFNNLYSPPRFESFGGWDIIIASASADTNGVILLWRVSLHPPARGSPLPVAFRAPSRPTVVFLHSPATSLSFNTSATSISRRHHLLVADRKGAVRILETRSRSWISSFYTSFSPTTDCRKKVFGAEWVTGGRGIVILCEDGEWGIWDLEGILSKQDRASVSSFLVGGVVGETWFSNRKSHPTNSHDDAASEFSGRSPSSRAMSTVSGTTSTTSRRRRGSAGKDLTGAPGLLSVTAIPGSNLFSTSAVLAKGKASTMGGLQINDEIITFVFGGAIMVIPSLKQFWKVEEAKMLKRLYKSNSSLGSGLWNGEDGRVEKEFIVLEGWSTRGATVTSVDVIPPGRRTDGEWDGDHGTGESTVDGNVARVLLGTSCRIILMDVKEPGVAAAVRNAQAAAAAAAASAVGQKEGNRDSFAVRSVEGNLKKCSKGKRKVGFLQDS